MKGLGQFHIHIN